MSPRSVWLPYWNPNASARARLICFPFAGGSASMYRKWNQLEDCEILAVQWPGREARLREPPFSRLHAMVDAAMHALLPLLHEKPFFVFGHSLGAKVAFELVRALERQGHPSPRRLFVAGCGAAHLPDRSLQLHELPDEPFLQALGALGATPQEVLASRELMAFLLPMIRADYLASERYRWEPGPPLRTGIDALSGEEDPDVNESELLAWGELTAGRFTSRRFSGGHFFLMENPPSVLSMVREEIQVAWTTDGEPRRCACRT